MTSFNNALSNIQGGEYSINDLVALLTARGKNLMNLLSIANDIRNELTGKLITFVINRNINFTNICSGTCLFCNYRFSKDSKEKWTLSKEQVQEKVREALNLGATEVCMQGGLNPAYTFEDYLNLLDWVREISKDIHIHAFSPEEYKHMQEISGLSLDEIIKELKKHGLNSSPGTAAEILVDEVREIIAPRKLTTSEWIEIIKRLHEYDVPTTATIMYGHVESPKDIAKHLIIIRKIQEETDGITEFVPLPFIYMKTKLYKTHKSRRSSTGMEDLALHATARIFFSPLIKNIQTSWVKLGPKFAQAMLLAGVNDLGGTLMEESISRKAGAKTSQFLPPSEFIRIIKDARFVPAQRDTLYNILRTFP